MKKIWGILVLVLIFCNVSFAECIKGNCTNGQGTYTWSDGQKYAGTGGIVQGMYKEPEPGLMEENIKVNGRMVLGTVKVLSIFLMEENL